MTEDGGDSVGPWLVVGLGNPGPQYAGNRHNVGAMVVAAARRRPRRHGSRRHRSRAQVAEARLAPVGGRPGERVVLAVPTAYMNESGGQVTSAVRFFKIAPERLLVVHDELDLPFGDLMLKRGGGEGGHNGLRSDQPLARHPRVQPAARGHRPAARAAWTRRTSCCGTSRLRSVRSCRSSSAMRWTPRQPPCATDGSRLKRWSTELERRGRPEYHLRPTPTLRTLGDIRRRNPPFRPHAVHSQFYSRSDWCSCRGPAVAGNDDSGGTAG